jgi:type I restriction enzyme R subunit
MSFEYSEDNLIEQTAIDLFFNQLGWDTLLAFQQRELWRGQHLGQIEQKRSGAQKDFL